MVVEYTTTFPVDGENFAYRIARSIQDEAEGESHVSIKTTELMSGDTDREIALTVTGDDIVSQTESTEGEKTREGRP